MYRDSLSPLLCVEFSRKKSTSVTEEDLFSIYQRIFTLSILYPLKKRMAFYLYQH